MSFSENEAPGRYKFPWGKHRLVLAPVLNQDSVSGSNIEIPSPFVNGCQ